MCHNNAETTRIGTNLEEYYLQQRQKANETKISLSPGEHKKTSGKQEAEMLKFLKKQNNSFHDQVSRTTSKWNNSDFDVCSIIDGGKKGVIRDDDSRVLMLIERLKEAKSDINTLQAQYIALESACEVQLQLHQQTLGELEECKMYIEELKDNISSSNESFSEFAHKSISLDEHKEIIQELLQENKYLEDKLSALWELPFLSGEDGTLSNHSCCNKDGFRHQQQDDTIEHIQELENEIDQYKQQIELLSKTNFDLHEHVAALERETSKNIDSLNTSNQQGNGTVDSKCD
jgi:Chromosome segregation ATPases